MQVVNWFSEKQGFQPEKAGNVTTADHHDRELWERYFKPCSSEMTKILILFQHNIPFDFQAWLSFHYFLA
jgi:hypothetical protein